MDERIRELFATLLQVSPEQIGDETTPASLERWDSMQHLIVVAGFEEEFGVDLDPEEAVEMYKDFATFKRILQQRMEAGGRRHG
ncbi:MAG TPA: acyl carrier protein [Candidatus Polarisedimenticolia bacterium]|jgi:acyl carrier protein|nr:acyl carrier protein [Candidatus Polarisedimenticolia bacterium]